MESVRFRYSNSEDEPALKRVLEDSWMSEENFQLGVTYGDTPLAKALAEDRRAPVRLITFEDVNHGVQGLASLSSWNQDTLSKLGLKSSTQELAYLADLRISPTANRRIKVLWRRHYRSLIESLGNTVLLTSVLDENTLARNALCDGRDGIHYEPVLSYTTFTLFHPGDDGQIETEPRADLGAAPLGATYRTNFNRRWKLKTDLGTKEIDVVVISDLPNLQIDSKSGVELQIEKVVKKVWQRHCQNGNRVIQIAASATFAPSLHAAFKHWHHIATPATLYSVTLNQPEPKVHPESTQRKILDISIL